MVFQEGGYIPFCITPQETVVTNTSNYYELQLKGKKKAELLSNLKSADVDIYIVKGYRVGDMQDIYHRMLYF